jgi:hypothetical protein
MQTRKEQVEQVQLWISVAQQPGLGGWLNVWLVSRSRRPKAPKAAAAKKLPPGACTA